MKRALYGSLNGPEIQEKNPRNHNSLTFSYNPNLTVNMDKEYLV